MPRPAADDTARPAGKSNLFPVRPSGAHQPHDVRTIETRNLTTNNRDALNERVREYGIANFIEDY